MKKNKGAISIFALLAMLFFLVFVMVAYNNIYSKSKVQTETTEVLVDSYKSDTDSKAILNQLMAGDLDTSDIKTEDEEKVADQAGYYIAINGKIYNIN